MVNKIFNKMCSSQDLLIKALPLNQQAVLTALYSYIKNN
jgi:hypothetical protein